MTATLSVLNRTTLDRSPPAGLVHAAAQGDLTAMRALADWHRERGYPQHEDDYAIREYGDEEIAMGYLLLAHECEIGDLHLQHIDQMLDWLGAAAPQPLSRSSRSRATKKLARQIEDYLATRGVTVTVSAGLLRSQPGIREVYDGRIYALSLPWSGLGRARVADRLMQFLRGAFPGLMFALSPRRGFSGNDLLEFAASELGWH